MQSEWLAVTGLCSRVVCSQAVVQVMSTRSFWVPFQWLYIENKRKTEKEKIRESYELFFLNVFENFAFP